MGVAALFALVLVTGVGCAASSSEPQQPAGPPPPRPPGPGAAASPPPSCPAGKITIESCVVGGMPREDGTASVSCGTSCTDAAPAPSPARECEQITAERYRCTAYAP